LHYILRQFLVSKGKSKQKNFMKEINIYLFVTECKKMYLCIPKLKIFHSDE